MDNIVNFLVAHWVLSSIFMTFLGFYIAVEVLYSHKNNKISPQLAVALINHQHAVVIDLRPKEAFDASHIVDAINIPQDQLVENPKKLQKFCKKPIIFVSTTAKDVASIIKKLSAEDFQQVLQLSGGMQEWITSGLPTTSSNFKHISIVK